MKAILAAVTAALPLMSAEAFAAQSAPVLDQQIMIIIATSGSATTGTGVSMTRLSFPSPEACAAAARIMQEDIRGGFVTARCLRTH